MLRGRVKKRPRKEAEAHGNEKKKAEDVWIK
jgi:hypothetical protein